MNHLFDLTGKTAMVTGGTRGLGRGMAEALLGAGARVAIVGSSQEVAHIARELAGPAGPATGHRIDLSNAEARTEGFDAVLAALGGGLDILVNCAGVQSRHASENFPAEEWDRVIEVNLTAVFHICQLAGRVMLPRASGKIINIASMLSFFGGLTVPAYAASKGGVMQLTKSLANEWAGRGVNVNAIAPGFMATEMNTALLANPGRNAEISARIPAGRWGVADDMKGAAVFLASSASDYVHGIVQPVDGGYLGR
jgi:2-deoxy-D-gluconate 3-dehydrogenase